MAKETKFICVLCWFVSSVKFVCINLDLRTVRIQPFVTLMVDSTNIPNMNGEILSNVSCPGFEYHVTTNMILHYSKYVSNTIPMILVHISRNLYRIELNFTF